MRLRACIAVTAVVPLSLALAAPGGATSPAQAAPSPGAAFFLSEASEGTPEDIALGFVRDHAAEYGVTADDLTELTVLSTTRSESSGLTHVNLVQQLQGLQVVGAHSTVSVTEDGRVLYVSDGLVGDLQAPPTAAATGISPVEALEAAAEDLGLPDTSDAETRVQARSVERATTIETRAAEAPVEARLVWQPTDRGLRKAWELVIDEADEAHLWHVTVDAVTGETLQTDDWTDHDHLGELAQRLSRSPAQLPTAARTQAPLALTGGSSNPVDDGSSYRVLAWPTESPNDGPRTLVTNPADAVASPFGWHDTDGSPGPEYTITRGNNVHAYTDQDRDNAPDPGSSPDGGADLTFDFEADLGEHSQAYRDAAVTNLFYSNNMIHDVLYQYGFDEASGNFQVTNYTGEGTGGDYVRAEAADGSGTNNANFSTPAQDGQPPRMQMYLWPGSTDAFGLPSAVTIGTGDDAVTLGANYARFTPPATNAGVTGPVVDAATGCDPYDAAGAVVVVTTAGAGCDPYTQVSQAEAGGAVAVVVDTGESAAILNGSMNPPVGIPAVSVTTADADTVRAAAGQPAQVHKLADRPGIRDGDLENGIIIHEYGHGVSNRLTGGLNINCLSGQEQMGEGWSDYYAITLLLDPALDDPDEARGMGPYALFQDDRHGAGIRPRPYSQDMTIQPFTYDRIKTGGWLDGGTLAAPHGIGHAWAATLWDMTWDLIDKHGFEPDLYAGWDAAGNTRSLEYVTQGLKIQGCGPGFVAGRDGIIAASEALGGEDTCTIWTAFARRGLGASAIQGTTARDDNTEAFDIPASCVATGSGIDGGDEVRLVKAGAAAPVRFNLGGDRGLDVLKDRHSPASQQVDCETGEPLRYAITEPTSSASARGLTYSPGTDRYQYVWKTEADWAGTCRELQIVLEDGTQHRAVFRFH
ncbi:MAG TPA: M36 family metallopeptidase [Ornithinicoccus sp.]|nr:M36 family metallopeptidase [Ornithinicoccus sp.]